MDRSRLPFGHGIGIVLLALGMLVPLSGCVHKLLLTPIYLIKGHDVPADYEGLEGKRVVVVCRPPASLGFRLGGVDRDVAKQVAALLAENVKHIEVVDQREVEQWQDEQDWDHLADLADAVEADMVVQIDLETFELQKGSTLYQGRADTGVMVLDMRENGREVWHKTLGEILYPVNSPVPAQEKKLGQFRREYISVLAEHIARHFYKHDPYVDFAGDSRAHR